MHMRIHQPGDNGQPLCIDNPDILAIAHSLLRYPANSRDFSILNKNVFLSVGFTGRIHYPAVFYQNCHDTSPFWF